MKAAPTIEVTEKLKDRFWQKVSVVHDETSCWNWTGSISKGDGYGRISVQGVATVASRVSYTIHFGAIPPGLIVLHRCIANRRCVRPDHLYAGTHRQNNLDAVEQHRHVSFVSPKAWDGERNGGAVLSEDDVRRIRLRVSQGERGRRLAEEYQVSEATISLIVHRKRWAHVA